MPDVPAVSGSAGLVERTAAAFDAAGPLARRLPDFEARPAQREMAAAVAQAIADGGLLLAEAGTGTGKTLAYLIPALLSGRRVLVSTGTKTLQEQIFFKDVPLLRRALGTEVRAAYMKGRGNYLCLHRLDAAEAAGELPLDEGRTPLGAIREWARRTETGDRAELEDLPDDLPEWAAIAATSENCLGTECPRYDDCFVTRMRRRAAEADVVIVNHHLLCADAAVRQHAYGAVIPECDIAVIDEAHQLEDVATQYFGSVVSSYRLDALVREGHRVAGAVPLADPRAADALTSALDRVEEWGDRLFASLRRLAETADVPVPAGRGRPGRPRDERVRVDAAALAGAAAAGSALGAALEGLEATAGLIKEAPEDLRALGRRAAELRGDLAFALRADDLDYVYYLESRGRGIFLRAAPIDVSGIVRELLLDPMQAAVLTSATLSIGGSFDYVRDRLGVQRAAELQVPSDFDYTRQALLYLPPDMPDPRSPAFAAAAAREVVRILERTRGRAFVLFTSYLVLRTVHDTVALELDYPLFAQGEAPRSVLLREFRSTPHAVLFATASFWQGVDVAGEALSCVIVDKLPFASPADPITAARIEAVAARGGAPFGEYQVPLAILTLRQGLGRLLRHRRDRGVLAVLDPRIRTMAYGRRFLDALPPAPIHDDIEAIARFFAGEHPAPRPAARR